MQIPGIQRNVIAGVTAVDAARPALHSNGRHRASRDKAIRTTRDTGRDMEAEYKETSRGGLAVTVIQC